MAILNMIMKNYYIATIDLKNAYYRVRISKYSLYLLSFNRKTNFIASNIFQIV